MLRVRFPPEAPLPAWESGCPCRCVLRVPNANISFGLLGITGRRRVNFLLRLPPATLRPLVMRGWATVTQGGYSISYKRRPKRFTALLSSFFISKKRFKGGDLFGYGNPCSPQKAKTHMQLLSLEMGLVRQWAMALLLRIFFPLSSSGRGRMLSVGSRYFILLRPLQAQIKGGNPS